MPSIEGGGVEKNLFLIANYLSKKINQIKIITADKKFKKKFNTNLEIISPKSISSSKSGRRKKYMICLYILLKIFLKNKNYVVFAFQANLYCTILCKLFGIKIIIRSNSSPSGWSKNIFKKYLYNKILNLADQVIVNSYDFKRQFKKIFSINAHCIYNPLNKSEIIKKSKEKVQFPFFIKKKSTLKIINVGRFTDQKDHITLLKSINLLKDKIDFKLLVIGRGVNKIEMTNYVKNHNLKNRVKFISFQSNPFKYIKLADLFVLSSRYEGLPNVLLEAITLKKFVISTNCPTGPREILINGHGGELVRIGDYKGLAKKILLFHSSKKKLNKKIKVAYNALKRFDYVYNLDKYFYLVDRFLKK